MKCRFYRLWSGIRLPLESGFRIAPINWKNDKDVTMCQYYVLTNFFHVLFLLLSLVTDPSFMSVSSLVLEFCPSEFCPVSEDWGEL